ncbi:MAG TPA: LmeA family phospholipid-binding protein, partial [Ilumatobacteraceae bacterium]|nr:LmeA family phospholipid-binding protein [Ilumatobacteraceae bacterium]
MAAKRRGIAAVVISSVLVIGLVVAFFIVDAGLRSYAEGRVEAEIADNLPEGATNDVNVSIGGLSVIAQYLSGSFDRVEVRAPKFAVNGAPAAVHIVASGVPVDRTKPIRDVQGAIDLGPDAVTALVAASGNTAAAELTLGKGTVSYSGTFPVFGFDIGYRATAQPSTSPDSLLFTPTDAKLT